LSYTHRHCSIAIGLARLEGFEPPTHGLEIRCSIQLSYRRYALRLIQCLTLSYSIVTIGHYFISKAPTTFDHLIHANGRGERIRTSDPLLPKQVR
jgi:hypothetical protein